MTMLELLAHLLGFYVAIGLMFVGFGYMFSGKVGGTRAARFYFGRSVGWMLRSMRTMVTTVLVAAWSAFVLWVGRPLVRRLLHAFRRGGLKRG
jgi:hypothetical protein